MTEKQIGRKLEINYPVYGNYAYVAQLENFEYKLIMSDIFGNVADLIRDLRSQDIPAVSIFAYEMFG
jgi:hypothetical protein